MRDQIAAAERAGIHAVVVNSANTNEWSQIYERIASGEVDVMLCHSKRTRGTSPSEFRRSTKPHASRPAG